MYFLPWGSILKRMLTEQKLTDMLVYRLNTAFNSEWLTSELFGQCSYRLRNCGLNKILSYELVTMLGDMGKASILAQIVKGLRLLQLRSLKSTDIYLYCWVTLDAYQAKWICQGENLRYRQWSLYYNTWLILYEVKVSVTKINNDYWRLLLSVLYMCISMHLYLICI